MKYSHPPGSSSAATSITSKAPGVSRRTVLPSRPTRYTCRHPSRSLTQVNSLPPASHCRSSTTTARRSEEHTSELQSLRHLVCRLLLEKKKNTKKHDSTIY